MRLLGTGTVVGADPAANTEWQVTVPAGENWRIVQIQAQLVTDGTAANREANFELKDSGGNVKFRSPAGANHIASTTQNYTISDATQGAGAQANTLRINIGSACWATGGDTLNSVTTNRQAGDNWGPPRVTVEKWG
jgi:hypothetical protein